MKNNWFEHWFDSPLHEQLYAKRDEADADKLATLISAHFPVTEYPHLLDLACGRGRHSINFAQKGYQVTGIDLAQTAIERAIHRAAAANVSIDFSVGDMRQPMNRTFDVVVNLFTSFGYFEDDIDNEKPIHAIADMLRDGGQVWIDFLNPGYVEHNLVARNSGHITDYSYYIRRWIIDGAVHKEIRLVHDRTGSEQVFQEYVRLLNLDWFKIAFQKYGLTLHKVYGDYGGSKYDPLHSQRMIMGCHK